MTNEEAADVMRRVVTCLDNLQDNKSVCWKEYPTRTCSKCEFHYSLKELREAADTAIEPLEKG